MVWSDINSNARRDSDESPLQYAIVTLLKNNVPIYSTVTGTDGQYAFPELAPGLYHVVETDPPGYRSTTADSVKVQAECGVTLQDFGDQLGTECPRGLIGVVWNDLDGDRTLEIGEPPLSGATLTLSNSREETVDVQVTGADGIYRFESLTAGVYTLVETNPPGFSTSTTLDHWLIDLTGCRVVVTNFGDQRSSGE
jgi:uncharacterized surface anchored protein